ncbi:MAG: UbiD family decarboxylase, partial [Lachnospiraceae bacterium]|nr:UbiD family decarboxylase [Lachnospiraceae bacterium]
MNNRTDIRDLRTAIEFLKTQKGQYVETDVEVNPEAELSGVYRYVGAGGTVMRPTTIEGPAMMFHNVKGFDDASVIIGLLASRKRVGMLFGCEPDRLGWLLHDCVDHAVAPVVIEAPAPCQEVVHLATDPDFDLNKLVPAPTNTPTDAGPYIT